MSWAKSSAILNVSLIIHPWFRDLKWRWVLPFAGHHNINWIWCFLLQAYKKGHFTLRKKRSDFELTDYVCPMSPVLSTRNKIINLINDAKSSSPANEQLYQNMSSSGEWRNLRRQNPSTPSNRGSGPIDYVTNESNDSIANKKEEKTSADRSPSIDLTTKSDSDLNEICTKDKPIKKESVIS